MYVCVCVYTEKKMLDPTESLLGCGRANFLVDRTNPMQRRNSAEANCSVARTHLVNLSSRLEVFVCPVGKDFVRSTAPPLSPSLCVAKLHVVVDEIVVVVFPYFRSAHVASRVDRRA